MLNQKKVAMIMAEFLGTATLAMVFYTIIARTSFPLFTALAAGGAVAILTLVIGTFSNAHVNPAVTFGLWSLRKIKTSTAIVYVAAQMLGGVVAWAAIKYLIGQNLTSIAGDSFSWNIFVAEAIGGFILLFGVAGALYQKFDMQKTAVVAGGAFFLAILVASLASNGVVNPAVAVGIQSWNWAYAVAPLVGAVIGANLYAMLYAPLKTKPKKKK